MASLKRKLEDVDEGYILAAEDNPVNQIVIEEVLENGDRPFVIVGNGQEALDAWTTKAPGLILMDISMPVMNGMDAMGHIRRQEQGTGLRTPILMLTAHREREDEERARIAGADDYLTKPISPEVLLTAIDQAFHANVFKLRA